MWSTHWTAVLLFLSLAAPGSTHSKQKLSSVILDLDVSLQDYEDNPVIHETLYALIANVTTVDCGQPRTDCKLISTKNRKSGKYKRTITDEDYMFSADDISLLLKPEKGAFYTTNGKGTMTTKIVFSLTTPSGLDYLKWTELVRIIYYSMATIDQRFTEETGMNINLMRAPPLSYIAVVIKEDIVSQLITAGVIMGVALITFAVLIPLSNTSYCHREPKVGVEADAEEVAEKGENF